MGHLEEAGRAEGEQQFSCMYHSTAIDIDDGCMHALTSNATIDQVFCIHCHFDERHRDRLFFHSVSTASSLVPSQQLIRPFLMFLFEVCTHIHCLQLYTTLHDNWTLIDYISIPRSSCRIYSIASGSIYCSPSPQLFQVFRYQSTESETRNLLFFSLANWISHTSGKKERKKKPPNTVCVFVCWSFSI